MQFIFSPLEIANSCKLFFADFYISMSFTEYTFQMQEAETLSFEI